jgi:hypothetical protein
MEVNSGRKADPSYEVTVNHLGYADGVGIGSYTFTTYFGHAYLHITLLRVELYALRQVPVWSYFRLCLLAPFPVSVSVAN